MPPKETNSASDLPVDAIAGWLGKHPVAAIWSCAFLLWISVSLILRMWLVHRNASFFKKLRWSFVLLVPLFGWLLYSGFFQIPDYTDVPAPPPADPP